MIKGMAITAAFFAGTYVGWFRLHPAWDVPTIGVMFILIVCTVVVVGPDDPFQI